VEIATERKRSIDAQKSFKAKILILMLLSLSLTLRLEWCPYEVFLEKLHGEKS